MREFFLGLLLVGSVLLVFRARKLSPLEASRPLHQEKGLPPLWIGHASTVFSLNALFGAYLIILMTVGAAALVGICMGGITALLILAFDASGVLTEKPRTSFEDYISRKEFARSKNTDGLLWILVIVTQLIYATGELLILAKVATGSIQIAPRYAIVFTLGVALIAYLYSSIGGWRGVFETDIYQMFFLGVVFVIFLGACITTLWNRSGDNGAVTWISPGGFWFEWPNDLGIWRNSLNCLVGFAMGSAFLLSSPDTWKRVFAVVKRGSGRRRSIWTLILAGIVPFAVLLPLVAVLPPLNLENPDVNALFASLQQEPLLLVSFLIGVTAAFLSSFDSALLSATHVALLKRRGEQGPGYTIDNYHVAIGVAFLLIVFAFVGGATAAVNPYLVGLLLMGFYAVLGGVILATRFMQRSLVRGLLFWPLLIGLWAWTMYTVTRREIWRAPLPEHLEMVPVAAGAFFTVALIVALLKEGKAP